MMSDSNQASGLWLRTTVTAWAVSTALGFLLTRGVHAGPLLYYLFVVIAWPLLYFVEHETLTSFAVSGMVQLAYAGIVVGCARWLRRFFHRPAGARF